MKNILVVSAAVLFIGVGAAASESDQVCSPQEPAWETCANWDAREFHDGSHFVRNNIWGEQSEGAGKQCLWAQSESCWGVLAKHRNGSGTPKGYPQAVQGWVTGNGFVSSRKRLGIPVKKLTHAKVHWKMDAPESGRYMALWDIYFHTKSNPDGDDKPHTSLMINQRIADDGYYATELLHCPQNNAPCPEVTFDNHTFKLWVGQADWATGNVIQLFLVPTSARLFGSEDLTLDLKAVIDGLRRSGLVPDSDYLTSIQIGWEIVEGGNFTTLEHWTALQDEAEPALSNR
jgi:hypothetical protein